MTCRSVKRLLSTWLTVSLQEKKMCIQSMFLPYFSPISVAFLPIEMLDHKPAPSPSGSGRHQYDENQGQPRQHHCLQGKHRQGNAQSFGNLHDSLLSPPMC